MDQGNNHIMHTISVHFNTISLNSLASANRFREKKGLAEPQNFRLFPELIVLGSAWKNLDHDCLAHIWRLPPRLFGNPDTNTNSSPADDSILSTPNHRSRMSFEVFRHCGTFYRHVFRSAIMDWTNTPIDLQGFGCSSHWPSRSSGRYQKSNPVS